MRIGTLCFATERGLGYLAKDFHKNGIVTDPILLHHGRIPTHVDWYPEAIQITKPPYLNSHVKELIRQLDVMLFFETPFDWRILEYCKSVDTKTVLMTMYECTPEKVPVEPDLYLCPSILDMEYFPNNSVFIPVPVEEPWELRTAATNFVHNSGYIGLRGRSGTQELLDSVKYLKSDLHLTVRSQDPVITTMAAKSGATNNPRFSVYSGQCPYSQLRTGMDVCVAPEKFNGLSLPLQECRASGMSVVTTNRNPTNTWLPMETSIPVIGYTKERVAQRFNLFDEAALDPQDIARVLDDHYGADITQYSKDGLEWAKTMSWEVLKPKYIEALNSL